MEILPLRCCTFSFENHYYRVFDSGYRFMTRITSELVNFIDSDNNLVVADCATDDVRTSLLSDDQDLASFFARPIYGTLTTWTPGASSYGTFNPWTSFFLNKRVGNRLSNFKLASAKLHVKFMLNGSPFHYGRFLITYIPLHISDTCTIYPPTADLQTVWPIVATQRMKIFLDPSEGVGGEMVLPFVWPYDAIDLAGGDFTSLGQFFYGDMNTLKHANAATTPIQITYAIWAEDVNMAVPTTVNISGLAVQGDEVLPDASTPSAFKRPSLEIGPLSPMTVDVASPKAGRDVVVSCTCCTFGKRPPLPFVRQNGEEYSDGPVSKMASAVASAAGKMSKAPVLGRYARATAIGASAAGEIAKLFGFSKPVDLAHPPMRMLPRYISDLANCDGVDGSTRITVDSKQEITVDPSVTGFDGGDELDIAAIAARESFITQFAWTTAKVSGNLLWNTRVNPFMGATPSLRYSPACEFASMPFTNWRGNMAFRIQIVCSRQHRGRLAVVWDPNYVTGLETNIVHTTIVDLDEQKDVVLKIPWGQRTSFLTAPSNVPLVSNYGTAAITSTDNTYSNGVLAIYCLNELAVPNSVTNNDVQVNVYACLCDAQYAAPNAYIGSIGLINQGDEQFVQDTLQAECAADGVLVAPTVKDNNLPLIYFGERVTSFRQLFKRFTLCYSDVLQNTGWTATTSSLNAQIIRPKFPPFRGVYSGVSAQALHVTGTLYENRVFTHYVPYVSSAFLCSRGGMRLKHFFKGSAGTLLRKMSVTRNGSRTGPAVILTPLNDTVITTATNPSVSYMSHTEYTGHIHDLGGTTMTVVQPVLEVEYPYYYSRRFDVPRDTTSVTAFGPTNLSAGSYEAGYRLFVDSTLTSTTSYGVVDTYVAAAEDFTVVWFQGFPPWSQYS